MSSISIYAPVQPEPVPHDGIKNPPNIYGQTKLAGEHLLRWYTENHGVDTCGIRPAWVWGPHRQHGLTTRYTTGMINRIAAGGEVYIDNPDERGAWLYVHDCVKAVMLVWNANRPAERIYTVSGSVHSIREVAQIAMKYCPGSKIVFSEKTTEPSPYATNFDDSPIKRDLGWKAEYTIEEAVRDHLSVVLNKDL